MTSSHLKAAFISSSLRQLILPLAACLQGKREEGIERKKEGSFCRTRSETCLLPQNIRRFFSAGSQPPPQPSLAFPLTQPPPALSQHSWPHAQLSHLQPGPASSPDQCGLEAETIKQSPALPLHRVRPPPTPATPHPDILTARSPRMLVHLLTTGFLSCLGGGVTAGHPVTDQGSWLP